MCTSSSVVGTRLSTLRCSRLAGFSMRADSIEFPGLFILSGVLDNEITYVSHHLVLCRMVNGISFVFGRVADAV